MAYLNSVAAALRPALFGGFRGYSQTPYSQSVLSLYKPYFSQPYGMQSPGGGYQPGLNTTLLGSPFQGEAAPKFTGAQVGGTGAQGAPSLAAGGRVGAGGPSSSGTGQFGGDPILAKSQAFAQQQGQQAWAAALAAMKSDVIRYGDPDLAVRILGGKHKVYNKGPQAGQDKTSGPGYKYAATEKAAANNPFSTVKELSRWNDRQNANINNSRNQQGLFYSSTRARDLGLQTEDYQRQRAKAAQDLQDAIAAIQQQLLSTQAGIQSQLLTAQENAYNRALAQGQGG